MSALPRQAEPFRGGAFRHVQFVASRAGPEIASVYASALLPSSRVFVGEALARLFDRLGREAIRKPDNDRLCVRSIMLAATKSSKPSDVRSPKSAHWVKQYMTPLSLTIRLV
jgi:hypothetical protein